MVHLERSPEGLVLSVRACPGARRNGVVGVHDGALKVAVNQAPEKGKANTALRTVLAEALGLGMSQIELISGQTSRQKRFLIRDLTDEELSAKIAQVLPE